MSMTHVFHVLGKDLRLGPRSPVFLWVLVLPLLITLVIQVSLGDLLDPQPRLGIVDQGTSAITIAAGDLEGIEVSVLDDSDELERRVQRNDLDAGLVLPAGFDQGLRSGARPPLELYVGGESLASNRIILAVTTIDLIRQVEGRRPPVDVKVVALGEQTLPLTERLVPFIVMYSLLIAGVFLPSFSIADEREKHTLEALLVTPMRLSEILFAKALLGFGLAIAMAIVTLWLNSALAVQALPLLVVLVVASVLLAEIGVVYGAASKNVTGVFTLIKATAFLLLAPTVFYIFPDWPQWIAKVFPTYWVINPVYEVIINGAALDAVWTQLGIAIAVIVAMILPVSVLAGRLEHSLAVSG